MSTPLVITSHSSFQADIVVTDRLLTPPHSHIAQGRPRVLATSGLSPLPCAWQCNHSRGMCACPHLSQQTVLAAIIRNRVWQQIASLYQAGELTTLAPVV